MPSPLPTTHDGFLNRRVAIEQPAEGYRIAIDTVFLAAAIPAAKADRILDLGCGVGGAMLCVACRVESVTGTGIELQTDLIELCRRNISGNVFASGLDVQQGDATTLPRVFFASFDHVLMNPPYHEKARHDASTNIIKRSANTEQDGNLKLWISAATNALKSGGSLTIIHRADRCEEVLSLLRDAFSDVEILPLLPKQNEPAKRVIIRARKCGDYCLHICEPLVLHETQGGYSDAAEDILRHAKMLRFVHIQ